jgi:pullulanase/glycogen debranching enzyme
LCYKALLKGGHAMAATLKKSTNKEISEGLFYPLGATLLTEGVNFAIYSQNARDVFLLLFDTADAAEPTDVIRLETRTKYIWHACVHGIKAGQFYGYKVRGDFRPEDGMRFNENKLLIDPYAKALTCKCRNVDNLLLAYDPDSPALDKSFDTRDSTSVAPKSIVMDDAFDWQGDKPSMYPLEELNIYEVNVKGFTAQNFICLLMFSAGTSMILGGDEFMRTQSGNNNAYCQDNPISWFDWDRVKQNKDMVDFWKKAIDLTSRYPALQSRKFLEGTDMDCNGIPCISWFGTDGRAPQWDNSEARTLCYRLDGIDGQSPWRDYQLFVVFNSDHRVQAATLPVLTGKRWVRLIDTSLDPGFDFAEDGSEVEIIPSDVYIVNPRSTVILLGK